MALRTLSTKILMLDTPSVSAAAAATVTVKPLEIGNGECKTETAGGPGAIDGHAGAAQSGQLFSTHEPWKIFVMGHEPWDGQSVLTLDPRTNV